MRRWMVLLLGSLLLVAACGGDDDEDVRINEPTPSSTAATAESPALGDHLHLAFELSRCGVALPALQDAVPDESGIHTHADGLIHVHPFVPEAAGANATLGVFFETVGVDVDDEGVRIGGETLPFEGECDGTAAILQVARWASDGGAPTIDTITEPDELLSVPIRDDGGSIAVGLVAEGGALTLPTSVDALAAPSDVAASPPTTTGRGERPDSSAALAFAPVLGVGEPPCGETAVLDRTEESCFELGPLTGTAEDVVSADARFDGLGSWTVLLVLNDVGIDAFNAIAAECYARSGACPSGQLAIVVRGVVASAPTVNAERFEADDISISGPYTEAEAKDLAELLDP